MMSRFVAVGATLALLGGSFGSVTSQHPISDDFICEHPPYTIHMVSKSPLVLYINNFVTQKERKHLQSITRNMFAHSVVTDNSGGQTVHDVRTSQSTSVDRDDVVQCIEDRALSFQGFEVDRAQLEPIQLVKYAAGEQYHFHTDWFTNPAHATAVHGGNRATSFFAYVLVSNDTTGGGTNFPRIHAPLDEKWCSIIDCDEPWGNGVTFRPKEGNAVYWENLFSDGTGDERTLHAGLPVTTGTKIGMNIWTRQGILSEEIRSGKSQHRR